jgi:hypothetical protein
MSRAVVRRRLRGACAVGAWFVRGRAHWGGVKACGCKPTRRSIVPGRAWRLLMEPQQTRRKSGVRAKKHLGFDAEDRLESKPQMFESFCLHRAFSPFLRVVSHPRCRSDISPHDLRSESVRKLNALASAFGLLGMQHALAADEAAPEAVHRPQWSVLVSFSPTYTNNALFRRDDRRRDVYAEPDVLLRLDGKLTSDISYRLYGRSSFDTFAQEQIGNETFALLGARLTRNILDWRTSVSYEHRFEFAGVYQDLLFIADDVQISTMRDFSYGPFTISPTAQLSYRFADVPEARRYRLDLLLPFEARITSRWSVVSTPFVEAYWFTDGLNEGRQDIIYSTSLGLRYSIANNISLTTSASYEWRTSNVPLRHYRDLEIGPRLDMAF